MRISFDIPDAGDGTITGDRESLLLIVEAARRDLNACAQALGGSSEWKNRYGKLAGELARLAADVPRVDMLSVNPMGAAPDKVVSPDLEWSTEQEIAAAAGMLEPAEDFVDPSCPECGGDGLVEGLDTIGGTATWETCPACVTPLLDAAPAVEDMLS